MVSHIGRLVRLERGHNEHNGVLYPREILPPEVGLIAEKRGNEVWWVATAEAAGGENANTT